MCAALNWCFTLNNYTLKEYEALQNQECRYLLMGKEIAPTTGTPHIQGYIQLNKNNDYHI